MGCVLLAALSSATPAHALPAVPLAVVAAPPTFVVEIDGHTIGTFTELVSLSSANDPATKGSKKFTVVLRRQATTNIEFAAWFEMANTDPAAAKKSVTLKARNGSSDTMRFIMTKAFPIKVEITSVPKSEVLMETVTMTCEFIQRVSV